MTDPPFCHAERLGHRYGRRTALGDVSLALEAGRVVGVAGPNGAGKSTLAYLLSGFLRPTEGRVSLGGVAPRAFRLAHGVGFLTEESPHLWSWTGAQLFAARAPGPDAALPAPEVIERLGLADLVDRPLHRLSKGQRRLVLAGHALLGPSRLIVLDEPETGLDPDAQDRLREAVARCAGLGSLVLVLSHRLEMIESACDRLLFIAAGRLAGSFDRTEIAIHGARTLYREVVG